MTCPRILRVFPRRTRATPDDPLSWIGSPNLFPPEADECHVSVTFTWDLSLAERLAEEWGRIMPTKIGGPATGQKGGEFAPGKYLRQGYVITSRGCPNKCWFCSVWKREGEVRELPITEGWNVLDDNLLSCSDEHIKAVFAMLSRQTRRPEFTGGLEAARLEPWIAESLKELKSKQLFFAYDTPDDITPLRMAGDILRDAGFKCHPHSHSLRCFVLCGFQGDTFEKAENRMRETLDAGFTPMAMLWRGEDGKRDPDWRRFQRTWARPAMIHAKLGI